MSKSKQHELKIRPDYRSLTKNVIAQGILISCVWAPDRHCHSISSSGRLELALSNNRREQLHPKHRSWCETISASQNAQQDAHILDNSPTDTPVMEQIQSLQSFAEKDAIDTEQDHVSAKVGCEKGDSSVPR